MNNLSQTKRAIEAREWRAIKREKRRFNMLLNDFTNVKFGNVYRECWDFFESLNKKYPNKHDLTKTKDYKRWKSQILNDNDSEPESATTATIQGDEPEPKQNEAEPESAEQDRAEPSDNEADNEVIRSDNEAEPPSASDILQIAASDLIPPNPEMDLDMRIDEIIRDLQQDPDLRDLLNAERNGELVHPQYMDEDEGMSTQSWKQ